MPWLKQINLVTGKAQRFPLDPTRERVVSEFAGARNTETLKVLSEGGQWFCTGEHRDHRTWLLHGSEIVTRGNAFYVFMEHDEARHPPFEAAAGQSSYSAMVYSDWLAEQGDPFAQCLHPAFQASQGAAGLWWLEGLERPGELIDVTLVDGLMRKVRLLEPKAPVEAGELQVKLERLLLRICHLRGALALEEVSIHPRWLVVHHEDRGGLAPEGWHEATAWKIWNVCPWPPTLRKLSFLDPAFPRAPAEAMALLQPRLRRLNPSVSGEG